MPTQSTHKGEHGTAMRKGWVGIGIGYGAGLLVTPALVLLFARTMTAMYGGVTATPQYAIAIAETKDIADAIDRYNAYQHHLPDPQEGLAALTPEFLDRLPLDPWGNAYAYEWTGPDFADVLSYGADGVPGGSGIGSDISGRYGQKFAPRPASFLRALAVVVLAVIPLAALAGAKHWGWAAGILSGTGTLWAILVISTLTISWRISPAAIFGIGVALCCLAGSVAILRGQRGAPTVTCASVLVAYVLLEYLFTLQ